jgi:glycosyltransferase involved in cell wall biosynthesis
VVQPELASFPEIIEATGGGLCVPQNNARVFADAWHSLLSNPERMQAMRERGHRQVEIQFSAPQMSKQFLELTQEFQISNQSGSLS